MRAREVAVAQHRAGRARRLARRVVWSLPLLAFSLTLAGDVLRSEVASASATGSIEGNVVVGPELSSRRLRFNLYPDLRREVDRPAAFSHTEELRSVVVYVESADGSELKLDAPPGRYEMRQQGSSFVPHVLPVVRGSTVVFPNADPLFHNVFSLSRAATFDLGRYPQGDERSVRFDEPGVVKVFCHIHSDMSGVVLVLPNRFYAIPDEDGRYRIDGLPPGEYRVHAWHERARPVYEAVRILPGGTSFAKFTIPLEAAAGDG